MGMRMKLSWLKPRILPFFLATPMTWTFLLPTLSQRPIGSSPPKTFSATSPPMTPTIREFVSSWLWRWRPLSSSTTEPISWSR